MKVKEQKRETGLLDKVKEFIIPADKGMEEILPYKDIIDEKRSPTLLTKSGKYQAYFRVRTTDLTSISDDELNRLINKFTYLNRVYLEPYKLISLTYPTETTEQALYWKHRIKETRKAIVKHQHDPQEQYYKWTLNLAYDNLKRVELVETLPELMFILVVYGKTKKELENHAEVIKRSAGRELGLTRLGPKEITNVLTKLMNPNTTSKG